MSIIRGSAISDNNPQISSMRKHSNVFLDLLSSTFYTVIGYVCLDVVFAISLHYISLNENSVNDVAGVGLAFTTVNVLLIPVALGTNQSLNVHTAQALGAQKKKLAQKYITMTVLVHLLYFIPLSVLLLALKNVIALTINETDREETSAASQMYLYFLLPSTLFAILYECVKSYMIANKIFAVFMYIQLFTAALHYVWCYLFIEVLDIGGGIPGAGLAIITTEVLNFLLCILVIVCTNYKRMVFENYSFKFVIKRDMKLFKSFLKTSFPIIAHIYADYFVFFLLNFIAISFGAAQLNAQLGLSNTSNVYYKFPISLSLALMTFIGNEMGARNVKRAKAYAWSGVLLYVAFTTVFLSLLTIFKQQWATFYSTDPLVADVMLQVYNIFVFGFFVIDGLQGTLTGILKGIERKEFVTYSTLLVYYLIGIPLVFYYSYDLDGFGKGQQVYGIWFAFAIVNGVLAILYLALTIITDWKAMSEKIVKRVEDQHKMQNLFDSLNLAEDDEDEKKQRKRKSKKKSSSSKKRVASEEQTTSSSQSITEEYKQIQRDQMRLRGNSSENDQMSLQETQNQQPKKFIKDPSSILPVMA